MDSLRETGPITDLTLACSEQAVNFHPGYADPTARAHDLSTDLSSNAPDLLPKVRQDMLWETNRRVFLLSRLAFELMSEILTPASEYETGCLEASKGSRSPPMVSSSCSRGSLQGLAGNYHSHAQTVVNSCCQFLRFCFY